MMQSRSGRGGAKVMMATSMMLLFCVSWSCTSAFSITRPTRIPQFTQKGVRQSVSQSHTSRQQQQFHDDIAAPFSVRSQWSKCRQRMSALGKQRQPKFNRKSLFAAALALVSLLKPKRVLAAMGGGMGGSKGPIAPMAR